MQQTHKTHQSTRPIKPALELRRFSYNFTVLLKLLPKTHGWQQNAMWYCNILGTPPLPPLHPILHDTCTWAAPYKTRCRNEHVSSIHTSFPYNKQPLPQSSDLLPRLDMDYPIVNRGGFFDCFNYDCRNVDMLSLSQCLVGHNDIKSPFLVFVLKVTTSFRNMQCMMNTQHTYDGLASYDGHPS